jgi:hypothetical protein
MFGRRRNAAATSGSVDSPAEDPTGEPEQTEEAVGKAPSSPEVALPPARGAPDLNDGGRLHSGAGYILPRTSTKRAFKAAKRVELEHRRRLMDSRKAQLAATRAEEQRAAYLPSAGEPGPWSGRAQRRLRINAHPATTEMLAGAYPFLAEEGLGSEGALIGQDAWSGTAFCYDPWELYRRGVLTNPNLFLAGQIGRGKSTLAKALATRFIAFGRRVYVPGDPKGEWSIVTRALGRQVIELGIGRPARLNPLDPGPPAHPPPRTGLAGPANPAPDEPARRPGPIDARPTTGTHGAHRPGRGARRHLPGQHHSDPPHRG